MDTIALRRDIERWLLEDLPHGDITTQAIFEGTEAAGAVILAREAGILAGAGVVDAVFETLGVPAGTVWSRGDGEDVRPGQELARIHGPVRAILQGERVALNILGRLSGIATLTRRYADAVSGLPVRIVDTRKTTPGLRALEKYAVTVGGGYNHRMDLSSGILIKENHIRAAGGVREALERVRERAPHTLRPQIEVETLEEFTQAQEAGAELILLDNMSLQDMAQAVARRRPGVRLEASGGVTLDRVREIAGTGVDFISVGALTHGAPSLDVSLLLEE